MTWWIDDKRFYFIDSILKKIDSYLFDEESDTIHLERTALPLCVG
ncbi:MAG: hypothetical protein ABJC98_23830 [Bacteroidota bacterium]